ncbi:helix-turn-helix domain-containing protein [Paenibacillus sp. N4]|uniref:LexA family protein n=1 Tax=Paenibacillus vietnamensis TaxID=2590547 RepID=UPI001CD0F02F|nr:LexA family transcriptional regulator [Paenibacillus vietnamensis]MCA0754879.1 helix-turn-helix domain-containing protein [Paenibacillus vietnamensis]
MTEQINITGTRIRELRDKLGLFQSDLAEKLAMQRNNISRYEKGVIVPPAEVLAKIASILNTSTDYLLGQTNDPQMPDQIIMKRKTVELVEIPIYGEIRAGYNSLAEQRIIGYEAVSKDTVKDGDYFYLIVKGDSMKEEGILEGMRVLVKSQRHCEHGKIGVVIVNGDEGTLKRVFYEGDTIVLQASNRDIPPRILPIYDVRIQGQVKKVEFDV